MNDGTKILIIEDDESISLGLKMNLEAEGFSVATSRPPAAVSRYGAAGGHTVRVTPAAAPTTTCWAFGFCDFDVCGSFRDTREMTLWPALEAGPALRITARGACGRMRIEE